MAPNEAAHANHARMLPGHVSTLAVTDPELIDLFDNFAFDEVLRASKLDEPTRLLCQLAAMIAVGGTIEFRVMLGAALNVGVAPVAAKEVVYQAVPYVGMARVFDHLHATNEVLAERGVDLPLEGQATTTPATRLEHGRGLQEQVVGAEAVALMYASAPADEQHIQRLLSANCFGDHVSRGGLDLATRELLTFSMLAALGGCEPQLRGHVAANLRVGNDRSQLIDVLTQLLPFIGYPRLLNALRVVDEAAPAAPGEEIPA
jgi:4-carboxymuconolactone decarboxylase